MEVIGKHETFDVCAHLEAVEEARPEQISLVDDEPAAKILGATVGQAQDEMGHVVSSPGRLHLVSLAAGYFLLLQKKEMYMFEITQKTFPVHFLT